MGKLKTKNALNLQVAAGAGGRAHKRGRTANKKVARRRTKRSARRSQAVSSLPPNAANDAADAAETCSNCDGNTLASVMTDIVAKVIYFQWMVMAPLFVYLALRLTGLSEEKEEEEGGRTACLVALFTPLLPLIPALLILCCVNLDRAKLTVARYRNFSKKMH